MRHAVLGVERVQSICQSSFQSNFSQVACALQVVWSAWLSTLGHAPSVMELADTTNVHGLVDAASSMVDKFVPVSFQVRNHNNSET